jgi:formamidopyrimidine-DNA glycosylase
MPELPEVETIARTLREGTAPSSSSRQNPSLIGRKVIGCHLLWERTLEEPGPDEFRARIIGQKIVTVGRRGKYIVFSLSEDTMLIHLRMSGDLLVEEVSEPFAAHHRMALDLDGGLRLSFNDPRKFGRVWLLADPSPVLDRLGPEPLDPSFSSLRFHRRLSERRRQIKPLLLDQTFLAGLGNIYADEALYLARIHPLTPSNEITEDGVERLWSAIRQVLTEGIHRNGASIDWV